MQLNIWDFVFVIAAISIGIFVANASGVFTTDYMTGYDLDLYDASDIQTMTDTEDVNIIESFYIYAGMLFTALGWMVELVLAVLIYYPDLTVKFGIPSFIAPVILIGAWISIVISLIKFFSNRTVGSGE